MTAFYYIASAVLCLGVLWGISMMAKVKTAVRGNLLGSVCMFLAILLTLVYNEILTFPELWVGMLIGTVLGLWLARKIKMIEMPQMVGLLNGFGGLASMIAGILTLVAPGAETADSFTVITAGLAIVVGGLTWSGSAVAAAKLQKLMNQKPVVYKGHQYWTMVSLGISLVSSVLFAFPDFRNGPLKILLIVIAVVASNFFGWIFAIRVGGADMPITISLLNSFSGVAGSIAGMAIADPLLVAVGGIVGASGLLLTEIMCRAMNRHLMDILLGKTSAPQVRKTDSAKVEPKSVSPKPAPTEAVKESANPGLWLKEAKRVIIIPGYGMALAQAQAALKSLYDELLAAGKTVDFAIHPVAGRMPGHMNVLLAEVNIPYEKLREMQDIDHEFADCDLTLIVGANDVINPAANSAEGTPIYGMPILNAAASKHLIICNFDRKPGYAGVNNPLYDEADNDHVILLTGDAKDSLASISQAYRQAEAQTVTPALSLTAASDSPSLGQRLADASRIIIVPGYGMALSQAQQSVKTLYDELTAAGKKVDFAIHPVAGRMPGHMNVLLAEVNIPYEILREMQDIDPEFKDCDVAIVIGANDVINPAANSAEGTPIYGMPVLNVENAKHVLILNFDKGTGYAGVPNPLYEEDGGDHVSLLLGDAKASLDQLLKEFRNPAPMTAAPATAPASAHTLTPGARLKAASRVIIVPGYGMALSQAQQGVKTLYDELKSAGKTVDFAIHPVAGRMPGHMNVLLAEVNIPYEKLREMQDIDSEFQDCDVTIVIGANDVINPAANSAEGTPIYGMPVLNVENSKHVLILNFDKGTGYAGVPNPLYEEDGGDHVSLLLGDAKASLDQLLKEFRNPSTAAQHSPAAPASAPVLSPGARLKAASRVIIVPGYGMALSQAQQGVKTLYDELKSAGKTVDFAIHPVAGRMPGHMNVLLAEVNIPYEKLREMQDIDSEFQDCDVTIVIGANDVINPAANSAEGTPIYGMPVLNVENARHVLILNFDKGTGYAGVPNPLYEEDGGDHVSLLLGDAKESLAKLLAEFRA